jgi:hypothetical protein
MNITTTRSISLWSHTINSGSFPTHDHLTYSLICYMLTHCLALTLECLLHYTPVWRSVLTEARNVNSWSEEYTAYLGGTPLAFKQEHWCPPWGLGKNYLGLETQNMARTRRNQVPQEHYWQNNPSHHNHESIIRLEGQAQMDSIQTPKFSA